MGQISSSSNSSPEHIIPDTVGVIQDEVLRHARVLTEIATLTYEDFQLCLGELNALSKRVTDSDGKQLVFAVKKGTDSTVLWKGTVKIACVKLDPQTKVIESYRLLNLNQFLKVFKTLQCQLTAALQSSQNELSSSEAKSYIENQIRKRHESTSDSGSFYSDDSSYHESVSDNSNSSSNNEKSANGTVTDCTASSSQSTESKKKRPSDIKLKDTHRAAFTASMLLEQVDNLTNSLENGGEKLGECCICLERKPDVMLPCAHAYCMPCIEQWNTSHKTCPFCRETLDSTDDTWVISDIPGSQEISNEICSALMELTSSPE